MDPDLTPKYIKGCYSIIKGVFVLEKSYHTTSRVRSLVHDCHIQLYITYLFSAKSIFFPFVWQIWLHRSECCFLEWRGAETGPGNGSPQTARRAVRSPQITTSKISRARQSQAVGPWAPDTVAPSLGGDTRTDTLKSKIAQQLLMTVWDRKVEGEVGKGIAEKGYLGDGRRQPAWWDRLWLACSTLVSATHLLSLLLRKPALPQVMFTTVKWGNVCRRIRMPCHVKHSFKGRDCCGWGKGVQNWKNAGCGETCSQDKTAEREGDEATSQKRLRERETGKSDLELSQFPHLENRNKQAATPGNCCKG